MHFATPSRTFRRITAAAGICLAAAAAQADPIVDPDCVGWASVRGLSSSEFSAAWTTYKDAGYRVIDMEVDEIGGTAQYAAIFQENTDGRGWASLRNLSSAEFSAQWQHYRDAGYRLIDQESYVLGGTRYYAGVWMENKEKLGWVSYRNVDSAEYSSRFTTYLGEGYRLIDVEAYPVGGEMRYAAVWVENDEKVGWASLRNMTSAEYSDKFDQYAAQGYRLLDTESYQIDGQQRYAAIWIKNTNGRGWLARRNMTATWFGNYWKTYRDEGYRLTDFEVYQTASGPRYAGVWRQNCDRASWSCKSGVDQIVQDYRDVNGIPGMTVVIAPSGEIKYMRGFGFRDVDSQLVAASDTIYRLASVSKAVSGTLAMKLVDQGSLDLDRATRSILPELPAHHTHDVRHLLNHQSGIRHYIGGDPVYGSGPWLTARAAMGLFTPDPLLFTPGTDTNYSTHAFTVAAAAMEASARTNFRNLLSKTLSIPYGLTTLQCEDRTDGNGNRSMLYSSGSEVTPDDISWKWAGGGMESDAVDLCRLGMKLLDGGILTPGSRDEMWTRSTLTSGASTGTGIGWGVTTFEGRPLVGHNGAQTGAGSYWLILPDDSLSVIVLSNQRGHDARGLARELASMVLDCSPTPACYADCDESGQLDFFDFLCFQSAFAQGDTSADCDESGQLDFFDFLCFQAEFAAGCP